MYGEKFGRKFLFGKKKQLNTTGMIPDIGVDSRRFPANLAGLLDHSAVPVIPTGNRNRRALSRNDPAPNEGKQRGDH